MTGERVQLREISGYTETGGKMTTTFWIADTAYAHREVAYDRPTFGRSAGVKVRRERMAAKCDELNAWAESVAA